MAKALTCDQRTVEGLEAPGQLAHEICFGGTYNGGRDINVIYNE